jgi:hypothetical protein
MFQLLFQLTAVTLKENSTLADKDIKQEVEGGIASLVFYFWDK